MKKIKRMKKMKESETHSLSLTRDLYNYCKSVTENREKFEESSRVLKVYLLGDDAENLESKYIELPNGMLEQYSKITSVALSGEVYQNLKLINKVLGIKGAQCLRLIKHLSL
jgi:hypothetical protein